MKKKRKERTERTERRRSRAPSGVAPLAFWLDQRGAVALSVSKQSVLRNKAFLCEGRTRLGTMANMLFTASPNAADAMAHPVVYPAQATVIDLVNNQGWLKQDVAERLGWIKMKGPLAGKSNGFLSKFMNAGNNSHQNADNANTVDSPKTVEKALHVLRTFQGQSVHAAIAV